MSKQIPTPKGYPFIGNVLDVNPDHPQESLAQIDESHGPIFRLYLPAERIFVANYALAKDLFDEARFEKAVTGPLEQVRNATKDGLLTAYPGEYNWEVAHRTLMPAFGPLSIQSMFGEMQDIVSQMVMRWARFGPRTPMGVPTDFTKLTLDSIALDVAAMNNMLTESFARSRRPAFAFAIMKASNERYQSDIAELETISRELLEARRQNPVDKKDLLNAMINGRDPKTGEGLDDDAIIRNMITVLIAGHETTSGLLSFLFYQLLENHSALRQAVEEVDRVLDSQPMTVAHLAKRPYFDACLKETLRLYHTAPAFSLRAKSDEVLNREYAIKNKECVSIMLTRLHRDPDVYGPDAEEFDPSCMLPDKFNKLPPNAWKPFGHGVRACIDRPFAIQEAIMANATILQTFHITKETPSYQLKIWTALTIKPQGFKIRARLRDSSSLQGVELSHGSSSGIAASNKTSTRSHAVKEGYSEPISILFGSNTGTCEALAQSLASFAEEYGYAPKIDSLDNAISSLKPNIPVVVITGSYEGQPPDNAAHFVEWLASLSSGGLTKVPYAVFDVGNDKPTSFLHEVTLLGGMRRQCQ